MRDWQETGARKSRNLRYTSPTSLQDSIDFRIISLLIEVHPHHAQHQHQHQQDIHSWRYVHKAPSNLSFAVLMPRICRYRITVDDNTFILARYLTSWVPKRWS